MDRMTFEEALLIYAAMPEAQRKAIVRTFVGIFPAFKRVGCAFAQAVVDECRVVETEMILLQKTGATMQ